MKRCGEDNQGPPSKKAKREESLVLSGLQGKAQEAGKDLYSEAFAAAMDEKDELKGFREKFLFPYATPGDASSGDSIYLCGNSLGLQPKTTRGYVNEFLDTWAQKGVEGHFEGKFAWMPIHEILTEGLMEIAGAAKKEEVCAMNSLTVNLNLMFVPFYRPTAERFKILMEGKSFPSDRYAVEAQIKFHGYDPKDAMVEIFPREGEDNLRDEDILAKIEELGDSVALVFFSGIQYYTGQFFDLKAITEAGHAKGCVVGFDLAHAFGNVPLKLHDWNVDFAVWCSYKYLNSGAGSTAGIFVHERHANADFPRFAGWWGQDKKTRFLMEPEFKPIPGAEGYQMSNPPVLPILQQYASVEIFQEATMARMRTKSLELTAYLEVLLDQFLPNKVSFITPRNPEARGCQLSLQFAHNVKDVHTRIQARGIICDVREPDVMRIAPTPLYNTYTDVYRFCTILKEECDR